MAQQRIQQRASRVTRFLVVQLIALVGWIIVQSFFSLSSPGRAVPFTVTIVIEAVWWIITLVIMFLLFRREYKSFVQAALDLEDANKRLREATNRMLHELKNQSDQAVYEPSEQTEPVEHEASDQAEHEPTEQGDQIGHEAPAQDERELPDQSNQTEQSKEQAHLGLSGQAEQTEHEIANQNGQAELESPAQGGQAEQEPVSQRDQAEQDSKAE